MRWKGQWCRWENESWMSSHHCQCHLVHSSFPLPCKSLSFIHLCFILFLVKHFFSLWLSLPLSPFTRLQRPEERGGKFQKPGDHSPLSASGPQCDRRIRIRIAVHSPQCPSDESEGVREGKKEGATGWGEERRGDARHRFCFPIGPRVPSVFPSLPSVVLSSLFYTLWRTYTAHMCMHA